MMANVRIRRYEVIGILLLTGLGLLVRMWQLHTTVRVTVDELNFLPYVLHFWDDPNIELLNPMSNIIPFARVYAYWESWTVGLFGRDLAGLRMTSVIIGTMTVPAVWWMTRHIFDRKTALLAAVVLATFPPHVHFSRIAINNIGDPLCATIAFGFLARGFQTHRRVDFALAGVALGCVPYFYEAGRLSFPLLTFGFIGFTLLLGYGRFGLRTNPTLRRNLFLFVIVAFLTALPVYYALINSSANFTGRLQYASYSPEFWEALLSGNPIQGGWRRITDGMMWAFLFLVHKPEDHLYYGGDYGLIITAMVPFFFLGLWVVIWRVFRRDGGSALLIAWLLLTIIGGGLMSESFISARFVLVFPALAIMIAVGVRHILPLLVRPPERLMNIALITLGVLIAMVHVFYYFEQHLPRFEVQYRAHRPYSDFEDAILRSQDFREGTQVVMVMDHLFTASDNHNLMNFLREGITTETMHIDEFNAEFLDDLERHRDHAIFVPRRYHDAHELIVETLGDNLEPQYTTNRYVPIDKQFVLYYYPAVNHVPVDMTIRYNPSVYYASLNWLVIGVVLMGVVGGVSWRYRRGLAQWHQVAEELVYLIIGLLENSREVLRRLFEPLGELLSPLLTFPRTTIRLFIIGAIVLAGIATLQLQAEDKFTTGIVFVAPAVVLIGLCGHIARRYYRQATVIGEALEPIPVASTQSGRIRIWAILAGVALLSFLTLASITADDMAISTDAQLGLWVGGVAFLTLGLIGAGNPALKPETPVNDLSRFTYPILISAVLVLAFFLRVYNLEHGIHRFIDELHSAQAINELWDDPNTPILTQYGRVTAFTWFYPLMQQGTTIVYGPSLTALRVVSAVIGVLTVWALWWLARMLFDRPTALLAMLMIAVFPPHIHFSRIGINNVIDPFLGTLTLALLLYGFKSGRRAPFVFAGIALGLTHYFYEGGRLIFTPLVIAFTIIMLFYYRYRGERVQWRYLGLTIIMTLALSLPVYLTWSANELSLLPRLDSERNVEQALVESSSIEDSLHVLLGLPETGWFYGGDVGLILPVVVPLFLLGLGFVLWRIRHPAMMLILMWLGAILFGNSLLNDSTDSSRYVVAFPVIALVIAVGARDSLRLFFADYTNEVGVSRRLWTQQLLYGLLAIALVVANVGYYFGDYLDEHHEQFETAIVTDDVLMRIKTLPRDTSIYIITNGWIRGDDINTVLRYYGRQDDVTVEVMLAGDVTDQFIAELPVYRTLAFFLPPIDNTVAEDVAGSLQYRRVAPIAVFR